MDGEKRKLKKMEENCGYLRVLWERGSCGGRLRRRGVTGFFSGHGRACRSERQCERERDRKSVCDTERERERRGL